MAPTTRPVRTLFILAIVAASLAVVAPSPASAASTTITVDAPPATARTYETTTFRGTVTPASATATVFLQRQVDGAWKDIDSDGVSVNGSFALDIYPHQRGDYLLRVRSLHGGAISNEFDLVVQPAITRIHGAVSPGEITQGDAAWVSGVVTEPGATPRVVVQRKVGNGWSDRQAGTVDPKTGRFAIKIRPSANGLYTLRVRTNGGSRWSQDLFLYVTPRAVPVAS